MVGRGRGGGWNWWLVVTGGWRLLLAAAGGWWVVGGGEDVDAKLSHKPKGSADMLCEDSMFMAWNGFGEF